MLRDLTFKIKPGEKIGIVGRTGSGKTTITVSLTRIVELFQGQILIDGQDIKQVPLEILRKCLTIIP